MRIRTIEVEGLWTYRDKQTIDITGIPLVVGVGENGVGKSAILVHSVMVAFYGRFPSRTIEESITDGTNLGKVAVEFDLDDAVYRVERSFPRGGSATGVVLVRDGGGWRAVSEKGSREVTAYMTELLGMSYETATMTWVAEQGQYGKFSGAKPADRFRLLATLFDLDQYAPRAAAAGKKVSDAESAITAIDGRVAELHTSLERDMDSPITEHGALGDDELATALGDAEDALADNERLAAELRATDVDREVVAAEAALVRARETKSHALELATAVRAGAEAEVRSVTERGLAARYAANTRFSQTTSAAREHAAGTRHAAESARDSAEAELAVIDALEAELPRLEADLAATRESLAGLESGAAAADAGLTAAITEQARLNAAGAASRHAAADAAERIGALRKSGEASCFTCGQHLGPEDLAVLIAAQEAKADEARATGATVAAKLTDADTAIASLTAARDAAARSVRDDAARANGVSERIGHAAELIGTRGAVAGNLDETIRGMALAETEEAEALKSAEAERDMAVREADASEKSASATARAALEAAETALAEAAAPDNAESGMVAALDAAKAAREVAIGALDGKLAALGARGAELRGNAGSLRAETARRVEATALRGEHLARLDAALAERAAAGHEHRIHRALQRAYSPSGIPAMILAGVVDQLNGTMNFALERLSGGRLSLLLRASRETAGGGTENKVTVYVQTPDGVRSYEALSGGQRFRVDLAIRIGLTQALARGTGTPIRTLILDEGWGTLDEPGIQSTFGTLDRLSETTNVITVSHIAAVGDALPARVEVVLDGATSVATVVR